MDLNTTVSPASDEAPEVQMKEDECSHIRGVRTAPVAPDEGRECDKDVRPLAKVIPLFRLETLASVKVALFDDLEVQRIRKPGAVQEKVRELWTQMGLSSVSLPGDSGGRTYQYYRMFVASLIHSLRASNDSDDQDFSHDLDGSVRVFLEKYPHGTLSFERAFRDLHKLMYLLLACERVAARSGC